MHASEASERNISLYTTQIKGHEVQRVVLHEKLV